MVPLTTFIERTREAKFATFATAKAAVRDEAAFEEMKQHLLQLYAGVKPTNTFYDGLHFVDCVPIKQQPSLRGAEPEMPDKSAVQPGFSASEPGLSRSDVPKDARTQSLDITLKPDQKDQFGNTMFCKPGSVPMQRMTLEDLTRFPTLSDFLRRGKVGEGESHGQRDLPADESHYYARGTQYVDNLGGDAWLNVWNPTVAAHRMSLSQLWVVGEGDKPKQTVEAGWQMYPDVWGSKSALFIFYTTNAYKDGCYNKECDGFVLVANNVYLGGCFTHYSSTDGGQWGFNLQWKRSSTGSWWLFYKGPGAYIAVGYYPKALFGNGYLASKANKIAFGGEDTGNPTAKQMGSGSHAAGGWKHAAFQNFAFYIDSNVVSQWANLTKYEPDPTCYTADLHNIYGSWGTYLYFGGPSCN